MRIEIRSIRAVFKASLITMCCSIIFSIILVCLVETYLFPPLTWDDLFSTTIVAGTASFVAGMFIFWQNYRLCQIKDKIFDINEELLSTRDELERQAITDSLTGLFNRRRIFQVIQQEISRYERHHRPFCLLLLDIDHFKKVNDTFGHSVGDEALRSFADILKNMGRQQDVVARTGGEEFCILLPEVNCEEAGQAAERLRQIIARAPLDLAGYSVSITASIGIAEVEANERADSIYQRADMALYKAKANGRNRVELAV